MDADGLVSYDMPQGDRRGVDIDLTDITYDGLVDGLRLTSGLGQLTDGDVGTSNFRATDARGTGIRVSEVPSTSASRIRFVVKYVARQKTFYIVADMMKLN